MNEYVFPHSSAIETLQLELSLLRILHHRNKNQHHLQPFFKYLSILKRTLNLLLENADSQFLLQKLRERVIPNAWESFSRIVARGEFITLGLVLCASVARIAYCLGGVEETGDLNLEEQTVELEIGEDGLGEIVQRSLLEEARIDIEEEHGDLRSSPWPSSPLAVSGEGNDKTAQLQELQPVTVNGDESKIGDIQPPLKRKRRKRGQDEIDILFAGL